MSGTDQVHVLVVDDEPQIRELVGDALSMLGYECVEAGDTEEAVRLAESFAFDLVITDIRMPGPDGIELVKRLRRRFPALPVIIMSGYADFNAAREALRLGVVDYITKPFSDITELQATARRAVETSTQRADTDVLLAEMAHRQGTSSTSVSAEPGTPGSSIGGYTIIEAVGSGGMGTVYKARHPVTGETVALKVLSRIYSEDANFVERFLREGRITCRLQHPNIVRGIEVGTHGDLCYLAMEFIDGRSLGDILKERGKLPEHEALRITLQVAQALQHLWEIRHVHRDIKPDNIHITSDGTVKITDLGLAKEADPDTTGLTEAGFTVGTARYISPEQARAVKDLDVRADIYSLGVSLYYMVTGAPPFSGDSQMEVVSKHLTEIHVPAKRMNPNLSDHTNRIIDKMMQKDRNLRYQTPSELIEDIRAVLAGHPPLHA